MLDNLKNNVREKGIVLINEAIDTSCLVDAVRIKQILISLVATATRFTEQGAITSVVDNLSINERSGLEIQVVVSLQAICPIFSINFARLTVAVPERQGITPDG